MIDTHVINEQEFLVGTQEEFINTFLNRENVDVLKVTHVALVLPDNLIVASPPKSTHADLMLACHKLSLTSTTIFDNQGFLLNDALFANRAKAYMFAKQAGQLIKNSSSWILSTDDLW